MLWDQFFPGNWQGWSASGSSTADVDGTIYFASDLAGLQAVDHFSGEPIVLNPDLRLGTLLRQAPGRLVSWDYDDDAIVGLDTAGNVLWMVPLANNLRSLAVDGMGNAIAHEDGGMLSSIDSSGAVEWTTMAPAGQVAADAAGIYIAGGGGQEHWLFGLDAEGSLVWQAMDGSYDGETPFFAAGQGKLALVGFEYVGEDENYIDFSVRVYDSSDGALAWSRRIDGPDDLYFGEEDYGQAVTFDGAGNVLVAGTLGIDFYPTNLLWLGRYAPNGTLLWSETVDDGQSHYVHSLTALPDGDLLASTDWKPDQQSDQGGWLLLFVP